MFRDYFRYIFAKFRYYKNSDKFWIYFQFHETTKHENDRLSQGLAGSAAVNM